MSKMYGCIVYGNPMQDMGDFWSLLYLANLERKKFLKLEGFISHTFPSRQRAKVAKGFFKQLGLDHVRIGYGQDSRSEATRKEAYESIPFFDSSFEASKGREVISRALIKTKKHFDQHKDKLRVILLSKLSEFTSFMLGNRSSKLLFKDGECLIGEVIVISDIDRFQDGTPRIFDEQGNRTHEPGYVTPHPYVANNLDEAVPNSLWRTKQLFQMLQSMGIELTVITRYAADESKLSVELYDKLRNSEHTLGTWLAENYSVSLTPLFKECFLPEGSTERVLLTNGQNLKWFCDSFLGGRGLNLKSSDDFQELYSGHGSFKPYGALAALCADPENRSSLNFKTIQGPKSVVRIAGADAVLDQSKFAEVLFTGAMNALETNRSFQPA